MPSLSPTMESGVISQWNFKPGDAFSAGDSLAEVQTDKASIDFETTDDGVMGLQFVDEGVEVACGEPICITLEEGEDWNAADFEGFVVENGASAEEATAPAPAPAAAATPAAAPAAAPVVIAPPVAVPPATPAPLSVPAPTPVLEQEVAQQPVPSWAVVNKESPVYKKMQEQQNEYVNKFGKTGFIPL